MAEPGKSHVPKWVIVGTAVLGLAAAGLLVVSRVYEVQKARAEAARAQLEADHRERELKPRPAAADPPAPRAAAEKAAPKPTAAAATKPGPAAGKAPTDAERLQGTWECVGEQVGGRDHTAAELAALNKTMTVSGTTLTITRFYKGAVGEYRGTFALRWDGGWRHFDLTGTGPGGGRVELLGVYSFDGDEFRVCYRVNGADDPKRERADGFSTGPPTTARVYVRFRRAAGP